MSRTGNLLFPDTEDDGWVSSIIRALPEKKPTVDAPDVDTVEDPVAIEAEAAFAELEAETATRDAISAAGWSAETKRPPAEAAPEYTTAEEEWQAAEVLDALDAAIEQQAAKPGNFTTVDDPIAVEAAAAFAETDADNILRDAIETAAWTSDAHGPDADIYSPTYSPTYSPGAIAALDSVVGPDVAEDDLLGAILDQVASGLEPNAVTTGEDGIFAAGWSAIAQKYDAVAGIEKLSEDELKALDMAFAKEAQAPGLFDLGDDPVGLTGDAVFAEIAADVAARDAVREAGWAASVSPVAIAETVPPEVLDSLSPLSISEQHALDVAKTVQTISQMDPFQWDDPVAMQADSVFSGMAAEVAISDAVLAARTPSALDPAMVARGDGRPPPTGPGLWEVEDLVRAEAEIAFEDVAYDLAYNTVDSLVTGEAAALAAFDQAIASGSDPEEALALAIAAAEEIDPGSFGLVRLAATTPVPAPVSQGLTQAEVAALDDAELAAPRATTVADDQPGVADVRAEDPVTFARVGENFDTLPAAADEGLLGGLLGGAGRDTLIGNGFEFSLDLDLVGGAGSAFLRVERDDTTTERAEKNTDILGSDGNDTLTGTANAENIFGYAGDDVLVGGQGADTLSGGSGADQFVFEGGAGAGALAHATSLGTDVITDFSAADGDSFGLSNADFGFGSSGSLTAGADYFEFVAAGLTGTPLDASGGTAGPGIVVFGDGTGTAGVDVYYTEDASAMTTANSYQVADISGANTGDLAAADFNLRA
ncbi:MAG: calcium-binding protein [Proteobacteria bacterium]|nr:calcium-binding protein [Pseudomonadota bacterium]